MIYKSVAHVPNICNAKYNLPKNVSTRTYALQVGRVLALSKSVNGGRSRLAYHPAGSRGRTSLRLEQVQRLRVDGRVVCSSRGLFTGNPRANRADLSLSPSQNLDLFFI